ncbi:hypothetical protein SCE1572_32410 [Sorangium cellulosum So0157-2]|uniref:Uncharacterized protein n=1 Tax=Sorangium cellulosum So0157-2 TaxID=1254432 RepID=S4XZW2_SORCE|nr:hypothetical protein SCE1572_32410 [Sorangium cellulosum So0157-2]
MTDYDISSVMHYPHISGGDMDSDMSVTKKGAAGGMSIYGMSRR